ncbi:MOSC domain-containing protein [Fulvivirgaceae bacterium BMA12]|uniref:MOSC domain-containing protein n=1 Tax=Agaribacillus aureus TaxID=3051825 RepID=A0ABT8LFB5_9BACT|nr:MOSC domain-containing protein [Fulvivirgaceae bacterium BMA12]
MPIISLNTGKVKEINQNGHVTTTAIFKTPVLESREVHPLGIEGDMQANLKVHGGTEKAVYAYPVEHYDYWKTLLKREDLPFGMFGENLSISEYLEDDVYFGDIFKVGSAELQVTMARQPCAKLNLRFDDNQMVKKFLASGRSGFYFRVLKPGEVKAGDTFTRIAVSSDRFSIREFNLVYNKDKDNIALLKRVIKAKDVPLKYKERLGEHLKKLQEA